MGSAAQRYNHRCDELTVGAGFMAPTSGSGGAGPRRFFWWRQDRKPGTPAALWLAAAGHAWGCAWPFGCPLL